MTADAQKDLLVIHEGQSRNHVLAHICKMHNVNLVHLKIAENLAGDAPYRFIPDPDVEKIRGVLSGLLTKGYDSIFTHNEFGEYGHGHHRQVHQIVKEEIKNAGAELFHFGYASPLLYHNGTTFWPDTLNAFGIDGSWYGHIKGSNVQPFKGIFKFKKYPDYFYFDTNYFLETHTSAVKEMVNMYGKVRDAWVGWTKPDSAYYQYLINERQYFYKPMPSYDYRRVSWGDQKPRTVFDLTILPHFKPDGRVLWVGWNELCVTKHYYSSVLKSAESLDILDKQERNEAGLYGNEVANLKGDICELQIEDEIYQSIICNGVLEYVDSIERAISELARITKKGGRILLGMPGLTWQSTGYHRPSFSFIMHEIRKHLLPVEVWRHEDYYYIHCFKDH